MKIKKIIIITMNFSLLLIILFSEFYTINYLSKNSLNEAELNSSTDNSASESESDVNSSTDNSVPKSESDYEYLLDFNYSERKKSIRSNADLTDLNETFAQLWKFKVEAYYEKISYYYVYTENTQMINKTKIMKKEWDNYYTSQMDYYTEFMQSTYGAGTIIPIKLSDYSRTLCRDKAIELYHLCLDLMIDVNAP